MKPKQILTEVNCSLSFKATNNHEELNVALLTPPLEGACLSEETFGRPFAEYK